MVYTPRDEQPEPGYPGAGQWRKPTDYEDELRPRREAYARVVADRHPVAAVARDMGVEPHVVEQWVEAERATRQVGRDQVKQDQAGDEARREQVRMALFERRQSRAVTQHEQRLVANLRQGLAFKAQVSDEVQRDGRVSVATLAIPACRAALAMLEADGEVVTQGTNHDLSLAARWVRPGDREAVRTQRRIDGQRDAQGRSRSRPAENREK